MTDLLYYTVLKYIPNVIEMKPINIGLAVHYPDKRYSHFLKITNISKIKEIDDTYNSDFFNMVMDSLSYELNYEENVSRFSDITNPFFLEKRTSYLANEFRFDKIQKLHTSINDYTNDVKYLSSKYLYHNCSRK